VNTMLRLMSERDKLSVVSDQRGTPTFARSLAQAIWEVITRALFAPGTYHWTDAGEITWYDFAVAIQEAGRDKGQLTKTIPIEPIPSEKYPTAATRPAYSVLDCASLETLIDQKRTPWRDNLGVMLKELSIQ
jgi:dTDP-4-dehydrorhamnose reductase